MRILVKNIRIGRHFPLQSIIKKDGTRNFTNDLEGKIIFIDKIGLEDMIKF